MKLLIVDDQLTTLEGLKQGIDWKQVGFDVVETAQNATEARASFARDIPDLLLCDIEMPVESGIDLSVWIKAQGYGTKIIFLTCHADFTYAQEAIQIGVSDYIVQPAPYHRIREKVKKVITEIASETSDNQMISLGKTFSGKQTEINAGLWRAYLLRTVELSALDELPNFPNLKQKCSLLLVQQVSQSEKIKDWDQTMLSLAVRNMINNTFEKNRFYRVISYMGDKNYALLLQKKNETIQKNELTVMLHDLQRTFEMYVPCSLAFYIAQSNEAGHFPEQWQKLLQLKNTNVTGKKGLYTERIQSDSAFVYKDQYYRWLMILKNSGGSDLEKDATALLDKLANNDQLSNSVLMAFHRDFSRLLMSNDKSERFSNFFDTGDTLYMDAMYTRDKMKELIHRVAIVYDEGSEHNRGNQVVLTVQEYIREHLSENIRKEDLTDLLHLNEDYLTRIFKKETGLSIKAYIIKQKMHSAREMLQTTDLSISSVAIQMGYTNFSHFAASYKKEFGISPNEEARGNRKQN